MIGLENYAGRAVEIRDRLARVLADVADADYNARGQAHQWQARADQRIAEWGKAPRQPVTDVDRICAEARQLDLDRQAEQTRRHEARRALRDAQEARPAPDQSMATLNLRDAVSGRLYAVTLPAAQVERVITNSLSGG
jgi:hypothetical protein